MFEVGDEKILKLNRNKGKYPQSYHPNFELTDNSANNRCIYEGRLAHSKHREAQKRE